MAKRTQRRKSQTDPLERVDALARNLWWTWHPAPQRLFAGLDPAIWETTGHNPVLTLQRLSDDRRDTLRNDPAFLELLQDCERQLRDYQRSKTWFQRTATAKQKRLRVAYFCAEFALHECLPIYAGGLGVLAGDHLKSASDLGIPLVGVGLLYRNGYYRQELRRDGSTRAIFPYHDFAQLPLEDTRQTIVVPLATRKLRVRIWQAQVGNVPLYLLDSDLPENRPRDRAITSRLYGGDQETRIQQEILLGIGGMAALDKLGVRVNTYHLNEGHAAFCVLEQLRKHRNAGRSHDAAIKRIRSATVFTTHTPVPAGHDRFPPALMRRYFNPLLDKLRLSRDELLALGRVNADDRKEPFCMTVLALRLSGRCNGVSEIHGRVSREMWTDVYDTDNPDDVPIEHITNGIHTATWLAPELRPLYDRVLKPRWVGGGPDDKCWQRVDRIKPKDLWQARNLLRRKLVHFIRDRLRQQIQRRCEPLTELIAALRAFDENALTIGFARRFATYKRAPLIFQNARRLERILSQPSRPVQLVFAGKAHPADAEGQAFAQRVYQQARKGGFRGRVVLLEDYDMEVGRMLTAGCDVWLNNPVPPQEASGTSGMKPPLHGGLNCSVLDGWWPEAYNGRNGWALEPTGEARSAAARDRQDATAIYDLLEDQIVPLFYNRDASGLPHRWVKYMQASLKTVCGEFNTHRMLAEYLRLYSGV